MGGLVGNSAPAPELRWHRAMRAAYRARVAEDRGDHPHHTRPDLRPGRAGARAQPGRSDRRGKPLRRSSLQRQPSGGVLPARRGPAALHPARGRDRARDAPHLQELDAPAAACARSAPPTRRAFAPRLGGARAQLGLRAVNDLVREHNEWYPVERDLPMDPRTATTCPSTAASYRRDELDAAWALRQVPARRHER